MKLYSVRGMKDGGFIFAFSVSAINSYYALKYASEGELIRDMEFDILVVKEVKND